MSLTQDQSYLEPLLRSGSTRTPPRQAFRFRTNVSPSPSNFDIGVATPASLPTETTRLAGPETESHRFLIKQYLGRAYKCDFGLYAMIVIQAICIALTSALFLGLVSLSQSLWLDINYSFMPPTKGQFNWVYVTAMGGFMAGLFLLVPGAPQVGAFASFNQMLVYLETSSSQTIPVVLATFAALSCGAPIGPEVALAAIATCLSDFLSRWTTDSRSRALLLVTSLAAGFAVVFPTAIFIPLLLVHELTVTGRPDKLTIDSVIAEEVMENEAEGQRSGIVLQPQSHDFLEGLTLQLASTCIVAAIVRVVAPGVAPFAIFSPTDDRDSEPWHYAASIVLGVMCGLVGLSILALYAMVCVIRRKTSKWLRRRGVPSWTTLLAFTTFAGVSYGVLAVRYPYSATMGLQFLQSSWQAAQDEDTVLNARDFCLTAIARSAGLALTLGCGFIGGSVLPMVVIGGCVGFSLSLSINWLPMSLAVPCCMASCPVSLCPIPLTATMGVALLLGCSSEKSTMILLACLCSWMLTGGLGIVRRVGEWAIGLEGALDDDESVADGPSDDDIIRSIRSTIFGER